MLTLTFLQSTSTTLLALIVFILIIIFYLAGHRLRIRVLKKDPDLLKVDLGTINSTLLGLLGLLLAFTFSMSSSRYDKRRELIVDEANNIGTAILRTDLYPDSIRLLLRNNFQQYVEERISFYEAGMDLEKIVFHFFKADSISKEIWKIVSTDARINNVISRTSQMIPAVNAMIDITTTRRASSESTVPDSIMYFLFGLCFCSSFLLGYDNKNQNVDWILVFGLATMLSITVFNIIDLDRPRSGLISMDMPNERIKDLRGMFK